MKVRVKFFAILREKVGAAEMTRDIEEGGTVGDLWRALQKDYPKIDVPGIRLLYAVNQNYVKADHQLSDQDEVVFVPPVSGGAGKGIAPRKLGKGGRDVENSSETFR
jgi:molybdopterin converting factor subunit 1